RRAAWPGPDRRRDPGTDHGVSRRPPRAGGFAPGRAAAPLPRTAAPAYRRPAADPGPDREVPGRTPGGPGGGRPVLGRRPAAHLTLTPGADPTVGTHRTHPPK